MAWGSSKLLIGSSNRSFLDVRHTSASWQIANGTDARTVSERLGHGDVAFTMQNYVDSDAKQQKAASEKFAKVLYRYKPLAHYMHTKLLKAVTWPPLLFAISYCTSLDYVEPAAGIEPATF